MKLEFQAKFLQHLNKKKQQNEGFTLIELLVVIIIIGILAAIALPSLLSQVNKGKQAEAKQNIGSINRAQQAYFLENDSFASDVVSVGIGIKTQSVNYNYTLKPGTADADGRIGQVNNNALARGKTLKSYLGQNFTTIGDTATSEVLTLGLVCETIAIGDVGSSKVDAAVPVTDPTTSKCPNPDVDFKDLSGTKKGV
ncbi:MAG TPA: type IV pilin-like G/H family protein [Candidatus Sericytochromatia bacterium]